MSSIAKVVRTMTVTLAAGAAAAAAADGETLARESVRAPDTTVTFDLVRVPAGEVKIRRDAVPVPEMWVSVTEVTWDLYDVYLYGLDKPDPDAADEDGITRPSKPYIPPDRGFGHQGYPALGMTRQAAEHFCEWLSKKTGDVYRIPTRAEWVHLALAGSQDGWFGVPEEHLADYAWFEANSDATPHPVGKKKPNAWGLEDVHGNVAEWVSDPEPVPFAMGGSYLDEADRCTVRTRLMYKENWQASDPQIPKSPWWLSDGGFVGIRLVREVKSGGDE